MPIKIGGGGKPQEYDPSNGRYGCGAAGYTKSYGRASQILSVFDSIEGDKKTSKLMPNYKKARTLDDKFIKYSLDKEHPVGKHKAIIYEAVLGYTKDNYDSLKTQIHSSIIEGRAVLASISQNKVGTILFKYEIPVRGPNGNAANIIAVYGLNSHDGKPVLITNYVKRNGRK